MNSSYLHQNYSEAYQEFFSKCSIVVSCPLMFDWMTANSVYYKGIVIKQKLPLKIYLGIEYTETGKIEFGTTPVFSFLQNKFISESISQYILEVEELVHYLTAYFKNAKSLNRKGALIHCLAELPFDHDLNHQGAFSAGLSVVLGLFFGTQKTDQLREWKTFSPKFLLESSDQEFQNVFLLAWKINHIIARGITWGGGAFSGLASSGYPIIYLPDKTVTNVDYDLYKENFHAIQDVSCLGYDSRDLFPDIDGNILWPIDVAIIFSGKGLINKFKSQKTVHYDDTLEKLNSVVRDFFEKDIQAKKVVPEFFENLVMSPESLHKRIVEVSSIASLLIFDQLHKILMNGYNETQVMMFIELMKKDTSLLQVALCKQHIFQIL